MNEEAQAQSAYEWAKEIHDGMAIALERLQMLKDAMVREKKPFSHVTFPEPEMAYAVSRLEDLLPILRPHAQD